MQNSKAPSTSLRSSCPRSRECALTIRLSRAASVSVISPRVAAAAPSSTIFRVDQAESFNRFFSQPSNACSQSTNTSSPDRLLTAQPLSARLRILIARPSGEWCPLTRSFSARLTNSVCRSELISHSLVITCCPYSMKCERRQRTRSKTRRFSSGSSRLAKISEDLTADPPKDGSATVFKAEARRARS
jgi:hypothetical protein